VLVVLDRARRLEGSGRRPARPSTDRGRMMTVVLRRVSLWLPPIVYMAIIFQLSAEPNPLPEITSRVWDKLLHATEYAGLAVLLCRALLGEGLGAIAAVIVAALATSVYGASDEVHQLFTPGRESSVFDWFADSTGAIPGAILYLAAARLVGRRGNPAVSAETTKPRKHEAPA